MSAEIAQQVEQPMNQLADGGSIPTSPLHIRASCLRIHLCLLSDVRLFIETHHYSHSVNGVKVSYCFKVSYDSHLIGAVLFGAMSTTAWRKFGEAESDVLELRRLCLLPAAGPNSESRVVGWCLRWIRKNALRVKIVVSYADPAYGHSGVIYRASNFEYVGLSGKDKGYLDPTTGKRYHSRALRTTYKGQYKPFVLKLRAKRDSGVLIPIDLPGKHCFVYTIRGKSGEQGGATNEAVTEARLDKVSDPSVDFQP